MIKKNLTRLEGVKYSEGYLNGYKKGVEDTLNQIKADIEIHLKG